MILAGQTIRDFCIGKDMLMPFHERTKHNGMTFGLGPAGYDIRIAETFMLERGGFRLASTIERFMMPLGVVGLIKDKSTWARLGLSLFNTVIDPGFEGWITLELVNKGHEILSFHAGDPIAHVLFMFTDAEVESPYSGKYQKQKAGPQPAIRE